uniref:2-oxoadipate dioxygenase/decarboxylase n=2 Tax=Chrysotila carterae TaxID=13221 RepID=A0A7S4EUF6_CHRCT
MTPTQKAMQTLLGASALTPAMRFVSNSRRAVNPTVFEEVRTDLLSAYLRRTPSCTNAVNLLADRGARVHNDHVALRSFVDSRGASGLQFLQHLFVGFGYAPQEGIVIPSMPVNAVWLEPPEETQWPKVFISELRVDEMPSEASAIVYKYVDGYYDDAVIDHAAASGDARALVDILETPPWSVTSSDEQSLRTLGKQHPALESATEYAAWTLTHAHRWNHATVLVNTLGLQDVDSIAKLNALLRKHEYVFNPAGGADGVTQGSREKHLEQSSTVADEIHVTFACGTERTVRCSFLELIERHEGFRGFLGQNAKGIFQSTWATN